jgi:hypothetical protein
MDPPALSRGSRMDQHASGQMQSYIPDSRDCSKDTGLSQLVHDEVMRGFVDGLRLGLHATYPAQDAH